MMEFSEGDYCFYAMKACVVKSIDDIQGSCSVFSPANNLLYDNVDIKNLHPIQLRYAVPLIDDGGRHLETRVLGFTKDNKEVKVKKSRYGVANRYFITINNRVYKYINFIHELQSHFREITGDELVFDEHWIRFHKLFVKNVALR